MVFLYASRHEGVGLAGNVWFGRCAAVTMLVVRQTDAVKWHVGRAHFPFIVGDYICLLC
jgi:hypothetical protein